MMKKAKEALDDLNYTVDQAEQSLSFESIETIRKALELLDKVEMGEIIVLSVDQHSKILSSID